MGCRLGLRRIEAAYWSSEEAFGEPAAQTNALWQEFQHEMRAAGSDDGKVADGYEYFLADQRCEAQVGLRLIREAFALTPHHLWEEELHALLGLGKNDHAGSMKAIRSNERSHVDEGGLKRLRFIANAIEHNNGHLVYQLEPNMFGSEVSLWGPDDRHGWHDHLRSTDGDVLRCVATVRASAPGADWDGTAGEIEP